MLTELTNNDSTGNDGGSYSYAEADTPGFSAFLLGEQGHNPTAISLRTAGAGLPVRGGLLVVAAVVGMVLVVVVLMWQRREQRI